MAVLRQKLVDSGWKVEVSYTAGPGHATQLARMVADRVGRLVIVFGGDGTIREAANGVVGSETPVLVVPSGTENILAKYLGIRANPDQLLDLIAGGGVIEFDSIRCGQSHLLLVAGVGFDAEVVRRLASTRNGHISYASYVWPIWRTFWSYKHPQLLVSADGVTVFQGRGMVFVGNVPRYAIGLRLLDKASPVDGLIDVCVFPCSNHLSLISHSLNALLHRHINSGNVIYSQARRIDVSSESHVEMEVDGDLSTPLPATFEIVPRSVRFLVAADWHRRAGLDGPVTPFGQSSAH